MALTITIILSGLLAALAKKHKPYTNRQIEWMKQDNDNSGINVFDN